MTMTTHVDIVSAEALIFSGAAELVIAPAEYGEVGIKPLHAQMLAKLKPGQVRVIKKDSEEIFYVSGGIIEVQPHTVTILADTAARADDLDGAAAIAAKKAAEEALRGRVSELEYSKALSELAMASAQIQAIESLRKKLKR